MNLAKLFETQKILRDRIAYNEPDRFDKLILALLVEIGECANEWRGFKFWSTNQEANTFQWFGKCKECNGHGVDDENYSCTSCAGTGDGHKNPLLEEYVDGLHFVLEIGLEHRFDEFLPLAIEDLKCRDITTQFTMLFKTDWEIYEEGDGDYYHEGLELYISLGEMLGFTWEQIEEAYFEKNQINHERQNKGY